MKQMLAIVIAGAAAGVMVILCHHWEPAPPGVPYYWDPMWMRCLTAIVFFGVLLLIDRDIFKNEVRGASSTKKDTADSRSGEDPFPKDTPKEVKDIARVYAGVTDEASRQRAFRGALMAVPQVTVLLLVIFYLYEGAIEGLAWGLIVFFNVYCLLWAFGLYFLPRTKYHTTVKARGDWLDRVGAFWLVSCAFGPFFGYVATSIFPITLSSWQWVYGLRVALGAGVPILLALPLLRYVHGKSTLLSLTFLLVITLLPISSVIQVGRDLREGPIVRQVTPDDRPELYLKHTERSIGKLPWTGNATP